MKRLLIFVAAILTVFCITYGQSITVTSPAAGDGWITGSTHDIAWTKAGRMHEFVKIRLFNVAGARVLAISDRAENNGLFRNWRIPGTIPPGDYTIRVKTLDDDVSDDSGVFSISGPETDISPEITVNMPTSSSRWDRGSTKTINWTTVGTMDTRVKIHLMNEAGTSEVLTVIANTPQDGSHPWPIRCCARKRPHACCTMRISRHRRSFSRSPSTRRCRTTKRSARCSASSSSTVSAWRWMMSARATPACSRSPR